MWKDCIDANGVKEWYRDKETWWGMVENIPDLIGEALIWDKLMDGLMDTDFDVEIYWNDTVPGKKYEPMGNGFDHLK
jgi:hypothetical protein